MLGPKEMRAYCKRRRARLRAAGRCADCAIKTSGTARCESCLAKRRYSRKLREVALECKR